MSTIDHAAEARKTQDQTLSYGEYGEDAGAIVSMISAQVHATLALVEQQRIANLIAVAQMEGGPYKDANNWTRSVDDINGYHVDDEDVNVYLHREIREGLGLS